MAAPTLWHSPPLSVRYCDTLEGLNLVWRCIYLSENWGHCLSLSALIITINLEFSTIYLLCIIIIIEKMYNELNMFLLSNGYKALNICFSLPPITCNIGLIFTGNIPAYFSLVTMVALGKGQKSCFAVPSPFSLEI